MLPESELKRIEEWYNEEYNNRYVSENEASLWYERMGKFAEETGEINIAHRSFSFDGSVWIEYYTNPLIKLTTPELINEFITQTYGKG